MKSYGTKILVGLALASLTVAPAYAHKLRTAGEAVEVAKSSMQVLPSRDWNRLDVSAGKNTETWTLDGEQLNELVYYAGVTAGKPLIREENKKENPLPKFGEQTLLVEIPELLEGTYRTAKNVVSYNTTSAEPAKLMGNEGIKFSYEYVDQDRLTRRGEARAAIIDGSLYMITFDAPKLHYFDAGVEHFRYIAETARWKK